MATHKKIKKRFYKRWWFWAIAVVVVLFFALVLSPSEDESSGSHNIHKTAVVNFENTAGEQTTKITKAYIKDVSDKDLTDDDGNDIHYALIVHLSIKNDAKDEAESYPAQGHIVLPNRSQIDGAEALDEDLDTVFKDGEIASDATKKGDVYFPLSKKQAKSIKSAKFKFEVTGGDENLTDKNYVINLKFK